MFGKTYGRWAHLYGTSLADENSDHRGVQDWRELVADPLTFDEWEEYKALVRYIESEKYSKKTSFNEDDIWE